MKFTAAVTLLALTQAAFADDIIADFEAATFDEWKTEGTAFGAGPAAGALEKQMVVAGFKGKGLASSFHGGDSSVGQLISPPFLLQQKHLSFLIGGGKDAEKLAVQLLIDGKIVRTATGPNDREGGNEDLSWVHWNIEEFKGKTAIIKVIDQATGGWGHLSVDHFVQSDVPQQSSPTERAITVNQPWLLIPVKNGAPTRRVTVLVGGKAVRFFNLSLADGAPDWWAHLDLTPFQGQEITFNAGKLPDESRALEQLQQVAVVPDLARLYNDPQRGQLRFSARVGFTNDPNGLVYSQGVYHMYFQHNPWQTGGGNTVWGHATSPDLVHWTQHGTAIYPPAGGDMIWSGSAIVDKSNTSGWKKGPNDLIVAAFTSTARGDSIAYSNDKGMTFTEFEGNPVVRHKSDGRDPRLMWHEPTKQWVMAVYSEDKSVKEPSLKRGIDFYTSPDLKKWKYQSHSGGYWECADLFELPLENGQKKWVLTDASARYRVGTFDGKRFVPETPMLEGIKATVGPPPWQGFYAAQTFSNEPKGRHVQIGWMQTHTQGKPFTQSMSLPNVLGLKTTPSGPRLTWTPAPELQALRSTAHKLGAQSLAETGANPLANINAELVELRAEIEPGTASEISFDLRGVKVVYSAAREEIIIGDKRTHAPLQSGKMRLTIYLDRNALDVYAADGLVFMPIPVYADAANHSLSVSVTGGSAKFNSLDVYELKSIWK